MKVSRHFQSTSRTLQLWMEKKYQLGSNLSCETKWCHDEKVPRFKKYCLLIGSSTFHLESESSNGMSVLQCNSSDFTPCKNYNEHRDSNIRLITGCNWSLHICKTRGFFFLWWGLIKLAGISYYHILKIFLLDTTCMLALKPTFFLQISICWLLINSQETIWHMPLCPAPSCFYHKWSGLKRTVKEVLDNPKHSWLLAWKNSWQKPCLVPLAEIHKI